MYAQVVCGTSGSYGFEKREHVPLPLALHSVCTARADAPVYIKVCMVPVIQAITTLQYTELLHLLLPFPR